MMAKMFYTLEETKSALSKSEEEVKQFAREGRLREFRDGPRLMFKADQVDQLKSDLGSGNAGRDMGSSDSGAMTGMADPSGASGSGVISLADTDFGKSPGAGMIKEDTALASDLGLSGSMGGVPSPSRTGTGGGSMAGSRGTGITVFDVDDSHKADPMAQTAIGSGMQDQVNLEGVGSGSGLLDLTRESDDTSLGAELLDEIAPGGSTAGGATMRRPAQGDSGVGMDQLSGGVVNRSRLAQPVYVEAADPLAGAFGGLALFGAIIVLFGGFVIANAVFGVHPDLVKEMAPAGLGHPESKGLLYLAGAGIGAIVFFTVGYFIGKMGTPSTNR